MRLVDMRPFGCDASFLSVGISKSASEMRAAFFAIGAPFQHGELMAKSSGVRVAGGIIDGNGEPAPHDAPGCEPRPKCTAVSGDTPTPCTASCAV
jgi:hypothetical protein